MTEKTKKSDYYNPPMKIRRTQVVNGVLYEYTEVWENGQIWRENVTSRRCTRDEGWWADVCAGMG